MNLIIIYYDWINLLLIFAFGVLDLDQWSLLIVFICEPNSYQCFHWRLGVPYASSRNVLYEISVEYLNG